MGIIRSDTRERTRYTSEYRQEALRAFEASSLSAMAFARHLGVKYSTFVSWVVKAKHGGRQDGEEPTKAGPSFLLAEIAEEGPTCGLCVTLPGGLEARATSHEEVVLLAALIKALA
jgi:transposase-like protein